MRSKKIIIGEEKQEDFDRLAAGWRAEYEPDGQAAESLLKRVILADWFLERAESAYMEMEAELGDVPLLTRTAEQQRQLELYLRYKTSAERSFYRAFQALRGLRKDRNREELQIVNVKKVIEKCAVEAVDRASGQRENRETELRAKAGEEKAPGSRAKQVFGGPKQPKKMRKPSVLEQWVEVEVQDGVTVTKLYPSNEGLIEAGRALDAPPDWVYRRLHFPRGVPEEYRWAAGAHAERRERGGMGTQRMTVDTWLDLTEREAASGSGHVGPTGVGNLPRPKERGGCDCEVCTHNREVLERCGEAG
jgi:hypothetical protein